MDMSAFQLLKNNSRTNINNRIHSTPIVQYARVVKVIDIQTVMAEAVVRTSLSREVYTVTLLNLSSALLEINAYPKLGDTVLLLFLQRYDPRMFSEDFISSPDAAGYNKFSGVGVLASTVKNTAQTIIDFYEDGGEPVAEINSKAELYATFNNLATITFCRAVFDSEDEQLITMCFGQGRPFIQKFLSRVEREYGFWKNSKNEWIELDAAVTEKYSEYAPITKDIQGSQTYDVGLGTDKDDNPVETDAPINETIHGKAPVNRIIRSPQNIIVGVGNDESGDAEEQRDAPVNITLGENADITFESGSGVTAVIERDVDLTVKGSAYLESADTDLKSTAPIGLNDGLYRTGLQPYLAAETAACTALAAAAATATNVPQLAAAVAAFCTAMINADTAANQGISKAVK